MVMLSKDNINKCLTFFIVYMFINFKHKNEQNVSFQPKLPGNIPIFAIPITQSANNY